MIELRDKRVLVMGLGVHGGGLGVARFLVDQGAIVTVTDLRSHEQLAATLQQLEGLPIHYVLGEHRDEDFRSAEIVIRNPGVPRESRYLGIAREAGAQIEMEMTLFFRLCPGPIIGITGTKGKTTTTLLTGAMLREQFPDTVVAGNLRVSALEQLPKIRSETPVVLELSSWQLEGLGEARLSPQYACYLNLYPDHLDRYGSMEAYAEAKEQIFLHQKEEDVAVFNESPSAYSGVYVDDKAWTFWETASRKVWFVGLAPRTEMLNPGACWTERDAFIGWEWDEPELTWRQQLGPTGKPQYQWLDEVVCVKSDVQLIGHHNLANIAAAAALAKSFGVSNENIRNAIRNFRGVPDRMELVREIDGVRWINDTTATAPAAAIAALCSLDAPTIVIAGGADKNLEFDEFARVLLERAKAIVLLEGTATPKLLAELGDRGRVTGDGKRGSEVGDRGLRFVKLDPAPDTRHPTPILGPFNALEPAMLAARELAAPGDVVLLSPGCASFGMFRNEFDRGEQFRQIARALV